ncbi:DUF3592 domain-containing protein [Herpetosiphon llansteffanensis]|uniref:DUF3592 domain-containing protein n=1 Tax=Herpetosiphon llansteffanensis TaxID=2094568 RepID=UPI000D7BA13D|nr:DUF3592 domain-containing protein [Herpetosiphon llansteffanensis]
MQPFLLNPKNAAVVTRQKPYGSGTFVGFMLLFSIPFLLVGCIALGFLLRDIGATQALINGDDTQATITKLRVEDHGDDTSYFVDYRFDAPINGDSRTVESSHIINQETYNTLSEGATVIVRYDPANPAVSKLSALVNWNNVLIQLAFAVMFSLFGGLALIFFVIRPWRLTKALRARGQMLPGQIINASAEKDGDGDWNLEVKYYFVSPHGVGITKTQSAIRNDLRNTAPPPANTPIVVMFADERNFTLL